MHVTKTKHLRLATCMCSGLKLTCCDGGDISVDRVVKAVVDVDVAGECDSLSSFIIHVSSNNRN